MASPPITAQFLLEGAVYALEQAGLLLRDANILYRASSFASAIVLAAFAREELGRYKILLDLRQEVLEGKLYTLQRIRDRCRDHLGKQQKGMFSITLTADRDTEVGKLMQTKMRHHPQSEEWQQADGKSNLLLTEKRKRVPADRHKSRTAALYVEPNSEHNWNRPAAASPSVAHEFLQGAVNDYAGRYGQGYITGHEPILKHIDPGLYAALENWPARPALHPPEWPPLVVV